MLVRNETDRAEVISKIEGIDLEKQPWDIKAEPHSKSRSTAQNGLLNAWYRDIAKYTGDGFAYTRGFFKWEEGVPILLSRGETSFDNLINAMVGSMTYEQIVELMGTDKIQISSVMKVGEFTDYLTAIEQHCWNQHIPLAQTDDYDISMGIK